MVPKTHIPRRISLSLSNSLNTMYCLPIKHTFPSKPEQFQVSFMEFLPIWAIEVNLFNPHSRSFHVFSPVCNPVFVVCQAFREAAKPSGCPRKELIFLIHFHALDAAIHRAVDTVIILTSFGAREGEFVARHSAAKRLQLRNHAKLDGLSFAMDLCQFVYSTLKLKGEQM